MKYLKGFIVILAVSVIGYLAGTLTKRDGPEKPVVISPTVISHGEADVGGAFELINTKGEIFTDQDLLGQVSLIYFGYTHCPDVCPLDMNRISMALSDLEQDFDFGGKLLPVFITVDPLRDPPEVVGQFLARYHPAFVGLTGTQEQMGVAARAYKVYYEEMLAREHSGEMDKEMADPVLFSHSAYIYLMDENGRYITHFDETYPASKLADEIRKHLDPAR